MRSIHAVLIAAGLLLGAACGGASDANPPTAAPDLPPEISPYEPEIDPADFVAAIDNPYMPFAPGTRYVLEGRSDGENERVTVIVTNKTKEIMGVVCTVVKDVARVDGEIAEKTFDWFAQDRHGNVWYFGEDSTEYEDGQPSSQQGSWEAGVDGALPGIVMLADPQIDDRYRQEFYEGEAEDLAQVLKLDASAEVPYGSFENVLITKDWTPLEPKLLENKYYASGVGVVLEMAVKGATERLELVEFSHP
jgi:hypothetical protein